MFEFIKQSLLGFIFWLNGFINDFGVTIIVFTLILKAILLPLEFLAFLEEEKIKRLRPKMAEIVKKYKKDVYTQAELLTELYRQEKYNPLFTFIIQFLPLPIFIAVFLIFKDILNTKTSLLFLQTINLAEKNIYLALATILFQFLTTLTLPEDQKKIGFLFLGLIFLVLIQFPALFNLYWLTNLIITFLERNIFRLYYVKLTVKTIQKDETDRS